MHSGVVYTERERSQGVLGHHPSLEGIGKENGAQCQLFVQVHRAPVCPKRVGDDSDSTYGVRNGQEMCSLLNLLGRGRWVKSKVESKTQCRRLTRQESSAVEAQLTGHHWPGDARREDTNDS
jgi:hypothetical protein